jgi:hypothetical protein
MAPKYTTRQILSIFFQNQNRVDPPRQIFPVFVIGLVKNFLKGATLLRHGAPSLMGQNIGAFVRTNA